MKKNIDFHFFYLIIIIFSIFVLFSNSLMVDFLFDDEELIVNNIHIKNFSNIKTIFKSDFFEGGRGVQGDKIGYYRPLITLSYMIDYSLWKLNPIGYHLTNIIWHIINSILVYYIVKIIFKNTLLAFLTSIFFALHPIHAESVVWISGRTDLISTAFFLASLLFYIKFRFTNNIVFIIFSLILFILSLLSKEIAVILPIIILITEFFLISKSNFKLTFKSIKYWLNFWCVLFLFYLFRFYFLKIQISNTVFWSFDTYNRLATFIFKAIPYYLYKTFIPYNLNVHIITKIINLHIAIYILVFLILCGIVYLWIINFKKINPVYNWALLFFIFSIIPLSNIIQISLAPGASFTIAERFMYLPSFLFCFVLGFLIIKINNKHIMLIFLILILVSYSVLLWIRINDWTDEIVLLDKALQYSPNSALIYNHLGGIAHKKDRMDLAVKMYYNVLQINPDYIGVNNNIGLIYMELGQLENALKYFNIEIEINPTSVEAYNNIGNCYEKLNNYEKSFEYFQKGLNINPRYSPLYNSLGTFYSKHKKFDEALAYYSKAIELNPDFGDVYNNIGIIYSKLNQLDKAIYYYNIAVTLNPEQHQIFNNIGTVYQKKNNYDIALEYYLKAINLKPDFVNALYNIGLIYKFKNDISESQKYFNKALSLTPQNSPHYQTIKNQISN